MYDDSELCSNCISTPVNSAEVNRNRRFTEELVLKQTSFSQCSFMPVPFVTVSAAYVVASSRKLPLASYAARTLTNANFPDTSFTGPFGAALAFAILGFPCTYT